MRPEWIKYALIKEIDRLEIKKDFKLLIGNDIVQFGLKENKYTMLFDDDTLHSIKEIDSEEEFWGFIKEGSVLNDPACVNRNLFSLEENISRWPSVGMW
ncbi:MAG: hypothetical protein GY928_20685 [Colwellia sp.]|nr:hypothetical protein [Colwellia sp.]